MIRNTPNQVVRLEVMDLAGNPFTGAVTVYVQVDTNAQAIGSVGGGLMTLAGHGSYTYLPSQAETNGASIEFIGIGAGAPPVSKTYDTLTPAQAQALQSATGPSVRAVLTVIKQALFGLAVYSPREPIKPEDADTCLYWLNLIFDDWAAEIQASAAAIFLPQVLTPGLNPHTIGPSGTWVLPARPPAIEGVSISLGVGLWQQIFTTSDPAWWEQQAAVLAGTVVGAFYSPDEPNGSLYLTGIPSTVQSVRLRIRTTFGPFLLTDVMVLPQGYESALLLTLQEAIADTFHATMSAAKITAAGKARARIFGNNLRVPSLSAQGLGLPGMRRGGRWDYRTGTIR